MLTEKPGNSKTKPVPNPNANTITNPNPNPISITLITCCYISQLQMYYYAISPDVSGDPFIHSSQTNK